MKETRFLVLLVRWERRRVEERRLVLPPDSRGHQLLQWDAAEAVIDWMPLTKWTLSQAPLRLRAVFTGASYLRESRHRHRRGWQQQQHKGLTSRSNPPQILSGPVNRNNGIISRVLTACRLHEIAPSCHSWLPRVSSGHGPSQLWHT